MKTNLESDARLGKQTRRATHAKERNLEGDTRQKLIQTATHAMKTNLEGDTRQKLVQTATHAMKTKLNATLNMETNL